MNQESNKWEKFLKNSAYFGRTFLSNAFKLEKVGTSQISLKLAA
jgi:hypothetical protein